MIDSIEVGFNVPQMVLRFHIVATSPARPVRRVRERKEWSAKE